MSSSISSFKTECKVLAVVACVLLGMEAAMYLKEDTISINIRERIKTIPRVARETGEARGGVFLGNSLTWRGVDVERFSTLTDGTPLGALTWRKVAPDATTIGDWYYILKNFFIDAGRKPSVVVVSFSIGHLQDGNPRWHRRLGRFFCDLKNVPEVFEHDLHEFGERAEFLISMGSRVMGNRRNIRQRILDTVVPYYREGEQEINEAATRDLRVDFLDKPKVTYTKLTRFIKMLEEAGVPAMFVAMPTRDGYEVDEGLRDLIAAHPTMRLVDCRRTPQLTRDHFMDFYHLDERGAEIYTSFLAERLKAEQGVLRSMAVVE